MVPLLLLAPCHARHARTTQYDATTHRQQNWCCQKDQSGMLLDCAQATVNLEGQWSNSNTNQHLRCSTDDYDQDQLVLFVR